MIRKLREKPIDVVMIARDDWANTGYRFWRCLQMLGLNVVMFKGAPHPYGYPEQAPLHPSLIWSPINPAPVTVMASGIDTLLQSAHVVHLVAATWPMCNVDWPSMNVVVQHGSSAYRQNPEKCNDVFNNFAKATIIQCPDLLGLGAVNEHLIYYPVDTNRIQPNYERSDDDKLIIGHFPSNPVVKGTETIAKVINRLEQNPEFKHVFRYIGARELTREYFMSWPDHLIRIGQCDIIIETCNPIQGNKAYGEWANGALEAAASGCVVVTNSLALETYQREYGQPALFIANNEEALYNTMKDLLTRFRSNTNLLYEKQTTRSWVETFHSMEATALRLWDKVYENFFGNSEDLGP